MPSAEYELIIETDETNHLAEFRLVDRHGSHKGDRQVKLPE